MRKFFLVVLDAYVEVSQSHANNMSGETLIVVGDHEAYIADSVFGNELDFSQSLWDEHMTRHIQ